MGPARCDMTPWWPGYGHGGGKNGGNVGKIGIKNPGGNETSGIVVDCALA